MLKQMETIDAACDGGRTPAPVSAAHRKKAREAPVLAANVTRPQGVLGQTRHAQRGMSTSSIHRWLANSFIAGEQVTQGEPSQIRIR